MISCFVSLTLSPALAAVLLKPHHGHAEPRGLNRVLQGALAASMLASSGCRRNTPDNCALRSGNSPHPRRLCRADLAHRVPVRTDARGLHPGAGHRLPRHCHPAAGRLEPCPDRCGGSGSQRHHPQDPRHRAHVCERRVRCDDKYRGTQFGHDLPRPAFALRQAHPGRECRHHAGRGSQAPGCRQRCLRTGDQPSPGPRPWFRGRFQADGRGPQ